MDKLTLISGTLFMAADVFAIVSLAMPDWIITDVGGKCCYNINDVWYTYVQSWMLFYGLIKCKPLLLWKKSTLWFLTCYYTCKYVLLKRGVKFGYVLTWISSVGDTRLGLMWTCMTLYNRPQICFAPDLQPEWLLALVSIFVGCICITTTIILLASSHWDRNVVPYARWVGFTASE